MHPTFSYDWSRWLSGIIQIFKIRPNGNGIVTRLRYIFPESIFLNMLHETCAQYENWNNGVKPCLRTCAQASRIPSLFTDIKLRTVLFVIQNTTSEHNAGNRIKVDFRVQLFTRGLPSRIVDWNKISNNVLADPAWMMSYTWACTWTVLQQQIPEQILS